MRIRIIRIYKLSMNSCSDKPAPTPGSVSSRRMNTPRIKSSELLRQMREIEIDHDGKIYRLRLTQANKLILTT